MKCQRRRCTNPAKSLGLCTLHYQQHRRQQGLLRQCSVRGCTRDAWSKGWCKTHHRWWKATGDPAVGPAHKPHPPHPMKGCRVPGCPKLVSAISNTTGLCNVHAQRLRQGLDLLLPLTPGKRGMKPYIPGIPDELRAAASRACIAYLRGEKPTPKDRSLHNEYNRRVIAWRLTRRPKASQLAKL